MSTTITPREPTVTIIQGDDMAHLADLRRAVDVAARLEASGAARIGDDSGLSGAQEALERALEEASERAVTIRFKALPRSVFRSLMAEHPPRDAVDDDAEFAVNVDTFAPDLLALSIVEPDGFDPEPLPEGEYDRLWKTAYYLNRLPSQDPKVLTASFAERRSSSGI